jgi:hypothetical protein
MTAVKKRMPARVAGGEKRPAETKRRGVPQPRENELVGQAQLKQIDEMLARIQRQNADLAASADRLLKRFS